MSQYLVKDGYMYYKEVAMAVLFWDVKVFDDDALAKYKAQLLNQNYGGDNLDKIAEGK